MDIDILLMVVWLVTAPILIWSRWNGPTAVFNLSLLTNALCGIALILKNWDFGK